MSLRRDVELVCPAGDETSNVGTVEAFNHGHGFEATAGTEHYTTSSSPLHLHGASTRGDTLLDNRL
jgi:hypothetical protein